MQASHRVQEHTSTPTTSASRARPGTSTACSCRVHTRVCVTRAPTRYSPVPTLTVLCVIWSSIAWIRLAERGNNSTWRHDSSRLRCTLQAWCLWSVLPSYWRWRRMIMSLRSPRTWTFTIEAIVDKHTPLTTRTVTVRPHTPRYNDSTRATKCLRRQLERRWRTTGLEFDRLAYCLQRQLVTSSPCEIGIAHESMHASVFKYLIQSYHDANIISFCSRRFRIL